MTPIKAITATIIWVLLPFISELISRTLFRKRRQFENGARQIPLTRQMARHRDPDLAPVRRNGDPVEAAIAERPSVGEPHPAHGYDRSVLPHAYYGVVAAVRHIKVRSFFERRVAGPVGSFRFDLGRGQINRLIQRLGVD